MPITTQHLREKLSGYKSYKDLSDKYAGKILKILVNVRTPTHMRELMRRTKMSNRFFYAALEWLRKHELVSARVEGKKRERGRKKTIYKLTTKGKDALEYLDDPKYDSLEFRVDGERKGKIRIRIKNDKGEMVPLGAFELALLMDTVVRGDPRVLEGVFYMEMSDFAKKCPWRLEIEAELSERDLHVGALENTLWAYYTLTVERELRWVIAEPYIKELGQSFLESNKEKLKPIFQRLIKEGITRIRLAHSPMGNLRLPVSFETYSIESARAESAYRRYWVERYEEAQKGLKEKGKISIERCLFPHASTVSTVQREFIEELKNPACRAWIERRLAEDPNFFMPSFFWSKLGYKVPPTEKVGASRPYNTLLEKPKFVQILRDLMWPFELMANASRIILAMDRQGEIDVERLLPSPAVLIKYPALLTGVKEFDFEKIIKDAFDEFIAMLGKYQHTKDFYEAWRVVGQHHFMVRNDELDLIRAGAKPADKSENFSRYHGKDLMIFAPIQEALIQYIAAGKKPVVDLARVYSDLLEERIETIDDAVSAIEQGEYIL